MSRIQKENNNYVLAYGKDHVFGLFLQIFFKLDPRGGEDPIVDKNNLTPEGLVSLADSYGFTVSLDEIKSLQ